MKGRGLRLGLVLAVGLLSSLALAVERVTLGVDSFTLGTQVWVAQDQGFFKKYGVEPNIRVFALGVDTLDAVLGGQTDFGLGLDFATLTRVPTGRIRIVSAIIEPSPGFHKLAVNDEIKTPADLKGKRLGIAQGTLQHFVTLRYLEINGVSSDQVNISAFSDLFTLVGALRAGRIDSAWVWGDGTAQAQAIPGVRIIGDDTPIRKTGAGFLVCSREFISRRPGALVAVLKALADSTEWILANPEAAARIVATQVKSTPEAVLPSIRSSNFTLSLKPTHLDGLKSLSAFMLKQNIVKSEIDLTGVINPLPLRAADAKRVTIQ